MTNRLRKKSGNITLTIVTNNIQYLGEAVTKQLRDLYKKTLQPLKKEIEDIRRQKVLPFS